MVKDQYGRRVEPKVVGYNSQPMLRIVTDPGGVRTLDPRWIRTK